MARRKSSASTTRAIFSDSNCTEWKPRARARYRWSFSCVVDVVLVGVEVELEDDDAMVGDDGVERLHAVELEQDVEQKHVVAQNVEQEKKKKGFSMDSLSSRYVYLQATDAEGMQSWKGR
jgi:hypothetical protein